MSDRMRIARKQKTATASPSAQSDTLQRSPAAPEQTGEAVSPIVQEVLSSSGQPLEASTREFMEPRFGHDFSKIGIHAPAMTESSSMTNASTSIDQHGGVPYDPSVGSIGQGIQAEVGGGNALDDDVQAQLEGAIGADLSRVRIHTDVKADQLARSVDAVAFTTGTNIFFRAGSYDPRSPHGLHLLAHEATHTVQQSTGPVDGTAAQGGIALSDPSDSFEHAADQTATKLLRRQVDQVEAVPASTSVAPQTEAGQLVTVPGLALDSTEARNALIPVQRQTEAAPTQPAPPQQEPDPNEIWQEIELRATPELLIKLQEISRAAGKETESQIDALFKPYEDSLESDQTFLEIINIPLSGAGHLGGEEPAGAFLAAAGTDAVKLAMQHILDFKSVGEVKKQANADIGDLIVSHMTSDSPIYLNFEAQALDDLRRQFDDSWARNAPDQRTLPIAVPLYTRWFQMLARTSYGVDSPAGQDVLTAAHKEVATQLEPVESKLVELKGKQRDNRMLAGALGLATTGAIIGGVIGNVPGAIMGGIIGGVAGLVAGALW